MLGVIIFLLSLGLSQGALVLSRYNKEERVEVRASGLCGNSSMLYCDTPSAYPVAAISRALRRQTTMLDMFDKEEETINNNIVKRSVRDYYDACPSTKDLIMPRVGTNARNQQRYLVNGAISREFGRLVQTVRVTTCDGEYGESCGAGAFNGVDTRCQQQFSQHKLVAYDMERGELVVESFTFPSCCSCMIHREL
jgi:hypothetical protein